MIDLVELEVRELIEKYGFLIEIFVICGFVKKVLEGDKEYLEIIKKLMNIIDDYVKDLIRDINVFFLMFIESIVVV